MEDQGISFREIIGIVRRRWPPMVAVGAAVLLLSVPAALLWPATYRSTATILIEDQEIPRDLVRSTVTTLADERIQVISQQVMTRSTLAPIVEKYDLYPRERRYLSSEEILDRMRRDIKVQTITAEVSDRRVGARAIAFRLSYDNDNAAKAQRVANELVTLYLNENVRTRTQRANEATGFLADEAERLRQQIEDTEKKLAVFKRANAGRLPELAQVNLQARDRSEQELDEIERQIRLLEDRKIYLEAQLTVVKESAPIPTGERSLEPDERLRVLRNQYASLSGVYSESHPDLVRIRREMEALEKSTGARPAPDKQALDEARRELARLSERYGSEHPDVVRQKKKVAGLEAADATTAAATKKPDNPAYVQLAAQIESAQREVESLKKHRGEVRERIASYQARLEQAPGVEQAYKDLTRDLESASAKYKEIRAKQMEAAVAGELEKGRKGERFSLIDPPQYPEKPIEPNRRKLLAMAFFGSAGGGAGAAWLGETLDRSVRSARNLAALVDVPVVGVVPRVENEALRRRRRKWMLVGLAAAGALAMLALVVIHFAVMPLDSVWYVLLRRLQL